MSKQKTYLLLFLLISLFIIFQLNLSLFGKPFHFHTDEGALLKRPLKLLLLYKNGDFSSSISVYVWIQNIWYGISFLIGKFFNLWPDFQAFKNSILLQKWEILFFFRILSIILTTLGHVVLIKLLRKLTKNNLYFLLISSVVLFNPITLYSTFWVKYEAISYLTFSLISYYSFKYFILKEPSKTKLYFILFFSFAVRIELSIFVFFILYFDFKIYHKNIIDFFYKNLKIISKGCVLFLIISLYPLVLYTKLFGIQEKNIGKFSNYGEAIYNKVMAFQDISIYSNALLFYSLLTFVVFFPLIIVIIKNFKSLRKYNFLIYPSVLFFIILILVGNIGTHYFLLISVVITISYVNLVLLNSKKIIVTMSIISLIYFLTLNFELIYYVNYTTDSRISSKNYIVNNIKTNSKILLEDYGNNGYSPPLVECTACSAEKYKAIIEIGGGTGEAVKLKSEMTEPSPCYQIVDLFSKDYLKGSSVENKYIILKSDFKKKVDSLGVFDAIILNDFKKKELLKTKFNKIWTLKSFSKPSNLVDPRLRLLIKNSHFNPRQFFVFTKKKLVKTL